MKWRFIPNIITVFRLALLLPISLALLSTNYRLAFLLIFIAGISDAVDGFLARRYNWITKFGSIADPVADKLLMLVTYTCLSWLGKIPWWLFAAVVGRDLWIMAGALAYRCFVSDLQFKATLISKINTFVQIACVIIVLFSEAFIAVPPIIIEVLFYLVLLTTLSSFIDYTWVWGQRAFTTLRGR